MRKDAGKLRVKVPESIVDEYTSGDSLETLALRHGISHMTIRKRLLVAGCKMRRQGRAEGDPRNCAPRKA